MGHKGPRTSISKKTKKNLMVFSGRAHPALAEEVAEDLGTQLVPTSAYDFANGEIYVRYEESVRGSDAFVIQSHAAPINEAISVIKFIRSKTRKDARITPTDPPHKASSIFEK